MPDAVPELGSGRQGVLRKLCEIAQMLEEPNTACEDIESKSAVAEDGLPNKVEFAVTTRRILLHPNHQVNIQKMMTLNRLYTAEATVLAELQSFFAHSMLNFNIEEGESGADEDSRAGLGSNNREPPVTATYTPEDYAGAYQGTAIKLSRGVDQFSIAHRMTTTSTLRRRFGRPLTPEHWLILEAFQKARFLPNAPEMVMVSRALRLPAGLVKHFVCLNRAQMRRYLSTRRTSTSKVKELRAWMNGSNGTSRSHLEQRAESTRSP